VNIRFFKYSPIKCLIFKRFTPVSEFVNEIFLNFLVGARVCAHICAHVERSFLKITFTNSLTTLISLKISNLVGEYSREYSLYSERNNSLNPFFVHFLHTFAVFVREFSREFSFTGRNLGRFC
jgi:hypothetical protein